MTDIIIFVNGDVYNGFLECYSVGHLRCYKGMPKTLYIKANRYSKVYAYFPEYGKLKEYRYDQNLAPYSLEERNVAEHNSFSIVD